ncbi:MAG: hypothetical protein R3B57_12830 [Phycisphaerales bacterium]
MSEPIDSPDHDACDGRALSDWLGAHDEACPICAYNLRGVRDAACPECNAPITLGVRSPNAIAGPWALALISFSLALGFDGVMSLFLLLPLIAQSGAAAAVAMWTTMVTLGVISGFGVVWMLRHRRVWLRMPARRQWRVAWTIFLAVGFGHALVGGGLIGFLMLL